MLTFKDRAILFSATPRSMAREIMKCSCTIESRIAFFVCIGFVVERQQAFDPTSPCQQNILLEGSIEQQLPATWSGLWNNDRRLDDPHFVN